MKPGASDQRLRANWGARRRRDFALAAAGAAGVERAAVRHPDLGAMEQRWGLPLIAWPSRLRPNLWDLVALPLVLGALALIAWGGMKMGARYEVGESLPMSLDPWRLPEYALRTVLRMRSEEHTSELQSHSDLVCRL